MVSERIGEGLRILSPQMSVRQKGFMGGGVYDAQVMRAMADLGTSIDILLMHDLEYEPHDNWHVYKIPIRRQFKLGWLLTNCVFLAAGLWLRLKGKKYDYIRVHSPYHTGLACIVLSRIFKTPLFVQTHHVDPVPRWRLTLERWVLKRADLVFAVSNFAKAQLLETFAIGESKIRLTSEGLNPVDIPEDPRGLLLKMGIDVGDKKVLSFIGVLDPRKNVEFLLDVMKFMPEDVILVVVGGDPPHMKGRLRKLMLLCTARRLEKRVFFTGMATGKQKGAVLAATDVFVFPSLLEGFGLAVVEAMSVGIPCVVSNRASLPEIVQDGVCGFLADPTDPRDFADKVRRILDAPDLRAKMGEAAKEVAKKYSWHNTAYQQLKTLRDLLRK